MPNLIKRSIINNDPFQYNIEFFNTIAAKCNKDCQNGGTCIKHDVCRCSKGYSGRYCETDINECIEQKPCDQICHNTFGSYYCQCREDFILQSDAQSCRKESK